MPATPRGPPLKIYCPNKSNYITPLATITLTNPRSYALKTSPPGLNWHGNGPSASSPTDVTSLLNPAPPTPTPHPLPPPSPQATTQHVRVVRGNYSGQSRSLPSKFFHFMFMSLMKCWMHQCRMFSNAPWMYLCNRSIYLIFFFFLWFYFFIFFVLLYCWFWDVHHVKHSNSFRNVCDTHKPSTNNVTVF